MIVGIQTKPGGLSTRTRWVIHAAILCVPILLSVFSYLIGHEGKLPRTGFKLFEFVLFELLIWGLAFAAAFKISGVTATELCLRVGNPFRVILRGIGYFILVRVVVFIVFLVQMIWIHPDSMLNSSEKVFVMTDAHNIAQHPAFSLIVFGIAAVIAGLSEEMWRVGMLRGLQGIFPRLRGTRWGALTCIGIVALIFGSAHLYLGWVGVENAILLGFFFGLIVVYRQSYWEAAIAHTLFDMLSFGFVAFMMLQPQAMNAMIVAEAGKGDVVRVEHLLKLGADVNGTFGSEKIFPLEMAAQRDNAALVSFLLEKGANPNAADDLGRTPLMNAAAKGRLEIIKLLVAQGANPNLKDAKGFTALRYAMSTHAEVVQPLIDLGADVNATDNTGETPLGFARKYGYGQSAVILEKNGGK